MKIRTVDGHNGSVGMSQNCSTPHVIAARKLWGFGERFERFWVEASNPSVWRWADERGHGTPEVPLVFVSPNGHYVPTIITHESDVRLSFRSI